MNFKKAVKFIIGVCLLFLAYDNMILGFKYIFFRKVAPHIYVSKNTPTDSVDKLLYCIDSASKRNFNFWKQSNPHPDIYFINERYLKKILSYKDANALFYATLFYQYIVVNVDGLNTDVIAHEQAHSILYNKLGFFKWVMQRYFIPYWFDEGVALQVTFIYDLRNWKHQPKDTYTYLMKNAAAGNIISDSIGYKYMASKYEVKKWLEKGNDVEKLLDKVQKGMDFEQAYKSAK